MTFVTYLFQENFCFLTSFSTELVNWGQNRSLLKSSGRGEQRNICSTRVGPLYKIRVKNDGNISALVLPL